MPNGNERIENMLDLSNFSSQLGIQLQETGEGYAVCSLDLKENFENAYGTTHGGVTYSLADTTVAAVLVGDLESDRVVSTIEGKLNYLRAANPDDVNRLICRGDVEHLGSSTAVVGVEIRDDQGRKLNKGLFTFALHSTESDEET